MSFTGKNGKKVESYDIRRRQVESYDKPHSQTRDTRRRQVEFQFSSGGVVVDGNRVLVINTKNLKGEEVRTFPKGHIEKKEKAENAAIREVEEETGYKCEIIKLLNNVQYWFKDGKQLIKKTVKWFLMKPIKKTGEQDDEVIAVDWLDKDEAKKTLSYKSDRELLEKI